nr:mechanosensitive ion channel domain-containing protein [Bosea robiniae]
MFFLVDDTFRHDECIETAGARGTVERISLRSVSSRHPRGPVATIPFGQLQTLKGDFKPDFEIVARQERFCSVRLSHRSDQRCR